MVTALVAILAAVALPTARFTMKRERESELRLDLRLMRNAIDDHKRLADQGMIQVELGTEGYPKSLEDLVEGVSIVGQLTKRKFLRRIPVDPMTGKAEWGLRSYQDEIGLDLVGWAERLRRLLALRGDRSRRHEVQGLVAMRQGTGHRAQGSTASGQGSALSRGRAPGFTPGARGGTGGREPVRVGGGADAGPPGRVALRSSS